MILHQENIDESPRARTWTCGKYATLNGALVEAQISHGMIVGVPFPSCGARFPYTIVTPPHGSFSFATGSPRQTRKACSAGVGLTPD